MNINNNGTILADTSPRLTRCHSIGPIRGTGSDRMVGAPRIILRENTNVTYVQSNNCELWYRNYDSNIQIKDSHISLQDIFDESHTDLMASISTCSAQNCKTCDILITHNSFNSNLTGRSFCTKTFENLTCKSSNVVYGIECNLCGLIYVGETKGALHKRISGHRFQINNGGNQLLYKHFNSPDHSILSMRVRILEKKLPPY